jgi:16S rRNA (cytidine1402-2'-O)-methyltransferase
MLSIISTPIGNLEDISFRAIRALKEADVIVCEDTRETIKLLKSYQIPPRPLISFYEEVESAKTPEILNAAKELKVALVSDAGTPLISDPGYKLVREAIARGIKVESIPGPCAAITALTVSGLPPDKFLFLGYPPEKQSHTAKLLESLKSLAFGTTIIFYVSPHKFQKFLTLLTSLNPPNIVVCRELTKMFEEVWQGTISEALIKFPKPKGEFVILFHV